MEKEIQINKSFLDIRYKDRVLLKTRTITKETPIYINITKEIPIEKIVYKDKIITHRVVVDTNGTSMGECYRIYIKSADTTLLDCGEEVYKYVGNQMQVVR